MVSEVDVVAWLERGSQSTWATLFCSRVVKCNYHVRVLLKKMNKIRKLKGGKKVTTNICECDFRTMSKVVNMRGTGESDFPPSLLWQGGGRGRRQSHLHRQTV